MPQAVRDGHPRAHRDADRERGEQAHEDDPGQVALQLATHSSLSELRVESPAARILIGAFMTVSVGHCASERRRPRAPCRRPGWSLASTMNSTEVVMRASFARGVE